jgi:hypothetical protein
MGDISEGFKLDVRSPASSDRVSAWARGKFPAATIEALLRVRDRLESGAIPHTPSVYIAHEVDSFNMATFHNKNGCGSVACIGGWLAVELGRKALTFEWKEVCRDANFYPLFMGMDRQIPMEAITPAQAVAAIDNFVLHSPGDPRWNEVTRA